MTLVLSEMHLAAFNPGSCSAFTKWGKLFFFFFFAMESITFNYVFNNRAVLAGNLRTRSCRTTGNIRTKLSGLNKQHWLFLA